MNELRFQWPKTQLANPELSTYVHVQTGKS